MGSGGPRLSAPTVSPRGVPMPLDEPAVILLVRVGGLFSKPPTTDLYPFFLLG